MRKLAVLLAALVSVAVPAQASEAPPFVPVYTTNFPDPFILPHGGEFLAYATNAEGHRANVQMARSTDLVHWQPVRDGDRLHDAMPVLPPWAREGWTWAPEVARLGNRYLLYFTAKERRTGKQCVGVAEGADPLGPFTGAASEPLVCQRELGGTIDPSLFRDADGQLFLYYKNDGNAVGQPTLLFGQRLSRDGLSLVGESAPLARNDQPWEAHVIESPTMVRHGSAYILFYSANHFGWEPDQTLSPYAMGYATCRGPMGPCRDAPENPILHSYHDRAAGCLSGPGHQAVFESGGREYIVFHAHAATSVCGRTQLGRYMYVAPLLWQGDRPRIGVSLRPSPR